jgi:hypothetical protein
MVHVEYAAEIEAPAAKVHAVITDYHVGHPAIVPKPEFHNWKVVQGGKGAGSIISFDATVMGQTVHYHQIVTEPEPGRVISEDDEALGVFTKFILDPLDGGKRTRVTISTDFRDKPGVQGLVERLLNPVIAKGLYKRELANLAEYVAKN